MQSISFYQKINNNKNKNTSALQQVEAILTIEASKDLINEKNLQQWSQKTKKHPWIRNKKTQQNVIRSEQNFFWKRTSNTLREIPVRDDDSGPNRNYFHIDNKRILLITIEQVIFSVQIRYNLFYERANKLHDC